MPAQPPSSTSPVTRSRHGPSRRSFLIGGGAGAGLLLGWALWPRRRLPNLVAAPGETILDAYLKIGADGRVVVIVPQIEMGQGVWTALPQALADELGADWRQVAVEPAPISPIYANRLLAEELDLGRLPAFGGLDTWSADRYAARHSLMITAGSTSIRAFELPFREAGAAARAVLCMAAAKRLGVDWRACDTQNGFVIRGNDRFRFGELAAEAAGFQPPDPPPLRRPGEGRISGHPMPRLDLPAKIDGGVRFAGDVRLPNMVYASVRHGPLGDTSVAQADRAAAASLAGVVGIVVKPRWIAALASSWWTADRALDLAAPHFATRGILPDNASVDRALGQALAGSAKPLIASGDQAVLEGAGLIEAEYAVPLAAHASIEPLVATARAAGNQLEVWAPTQSPSLTRAALARATGYGEDRITIFPMPVGGGFGRKLENDAAIEAATLAIESKRPVQLMWGRAEELQRARHRPPARARLRARLDGQRIVGWRVGIATPAMTAALIDRLNGSSTDPAPERAALAGAVPPHSIPAMAIAHAPAEIGMETGLWRSAAHSYTAFFTESFVDELAQKAGVDSLAFRMAQLGANPRLARCLARATAAGGWTGEQGAAQGIAVHAAFGSHIALLAEATPGEDGPTVTRLFAAVDCGRMINPDIVKQQIESGLIWGLAAALGGTMHYTRGIADQRGFDALDLPRLADMPEIVVQLIQSSEAPGGVAEVAVPVVAPAIANAMASATGKRVRTLPLA